jgi:hypothetical protein
MRKRVPPRPTVRHPAARPASTSSASNPPSGPTARQARPPRPTRGQDAAGSPPGWASRRTSAASWRANAAQGTGSSRAHQAVPAALLGRLDDHPAEPLELGGPGVHHRAPGPQGDQPGHAQFGRLLDQPVEPIGLGHGRRQGQVARRGAVRQRVAAGGQVDPVAAQARHDGPVRSPPAVEDLDDVPRPQPAHPGQVARLVPGQHQAAGDGGIGAVEAVGHRAGCLGLPTLGGRPGAGQRPKPAVHPNRW